MAGFGAAQLVIGPVSDRIGRRPVMIASIGLDLIGGLACWLAPGLGALLAGRCVQGAGAAGGTVSRLRRHPRPLRGRRHPRPALHR
jgi:DHA1 family bicyclomycin/chloramphenicol resistance-like MFS transporter